eukprot:CAMPEP_0117456686 /NCGR_PEP_ID=MMETSP0759-20121206/12004_1 /TAXON_ID=63605 /ORGANISM="Percolomonas cosmopolitus, Strain WS" /LENGTH=824 /DNA_ID=CAMNT_0005250031 /DNA_START=26 /DNA_END=2500 /DNA_ORIENTATION=+
MPIPTFLQYLESSLDTTQKRILRHFQGDKLSDYLHDGKKLDENALRDEDSVERDQHRPQYQEEIDILLKYWREELIFRLTMHMSASSHLSTSFSEFNKMNQTHFQKQIAESVGMSHEDAQSASLGTLPSQKYQQEILALQQRIYLMDRQEKKLREEIEQQQILLDNRQKKMELQRKEHLIRIHGLSRDLDSMVAQYFDNLMEEIANSQEKANKLFSDEDALTEFHDLNSDPQWEGVMRQLRKQRYAFRHVFRKHRTILSMLRDKTDHLLSEAKKRKRRDGTDMKNLVARRRTVLNKEGNVDEEDVIRMVSFAEAKNVSIQTNEAVVWSRTPMIGSFGAGIGSAADGSGGSHSTVGDYSEDGSGYHATTSNTHSLEDRLMEQGNLFVDKIIHLEERVTKLTRTNHWLNMELEDCHARLCNPHSRRKDLLNPEHPTARGSISSAHHHQHFSQQQSLEAPHLGQSAEREHAEIVSPRTDRHISQDTVLSHARSTDSISDTESDFTGPGNSGRQTHSGEDSSDDGHTRSEFASSPQQNEAAEKSINIRIPTSSTVSSGMRVRISDSKRSKRARHDKGTRKDPLDTSKRDPLARRRKEVGGGRSLHESKHFHTKETESPAARAELLLEQLMTLSHEIDEYNARDESEFMHTFSRRRNSRFVDDHAMLNPMSPRRNSLDSKAELIQISEKRFKNDKHRGNNQPSFEVVTQQRDANLKKNTAEFFSVMKKPIATKPSTSSGGIRKPAMTTTTKSKRNVNSSSSTRKKLPHIKTSNASSMQQHTSAQQLYDIARRPPIQIDIERTLAYQKHEKPLVAAPIFKINHLEEWDLE